MNKTFLNVAIQAPVKTLFDYKINPTSKIKPKIGQRILVPFGKKKRLGFIHSISKSSSVESSRLKPFIEIVDKEPIIDKKTRAIIDWCSNYYHYPIGNIYAGAVPKYLRESKYPKQIDSCLFSSLKEKRKILTETQNNALALCKKQLRKKKVVLLNGITGSGKTEIYMRLMESEMSKGNQALFLVPEIGLTPQISFVLTDRFGDMVKIMHSGTSAKKRAEIWLGAKEGKIQLVVGTRSAIFTPFSSLGIVIVDEEHDQSYKQQTGLMYSARDLAVVKSKDHESNLVLGSATPSFESLHNVENKKYVSVEMNKRVFSTPSPKTKVIDLRVHQTNKGLAQPLINDIKTQLKKNKQVLIYLNRRGYAPLTMCSECGHIEECPRCDSNLVLYKQRELLRCHHCAFEKTVSGLCGLCKSENIVIGKGTQKIEECLKEQFPKETVLRIDRDSTRSMKKREEIFNLARSGKAKILIGTQMLTKGHDFPNLSMVAIVNADQGIFGSDFRSGERFAQHFFQASGRAGRRDERGMVVIQTNNPDNFLLKEIITKDYLSFYSSAILEREGRWPPYNGAVLIRAESINKKRMFNFLSKITRFCNTIPNNTTIVLGPVSSPIERKLGKYRGQILLLNTNKKKLHNTINKVDLFLEKNGGNNMIRWQIDIDPLDMS